MRYNADHLRKAIQESLNKVNNQIEVVDRLAKEEKMSPNEMRDSFGGFVMIPLLAARVQALHALALLNQKDK